MKHIYTALTVAVIVLGMSSCSSSRNAQNTDDIYYSDGTRKAAAGSSNQGDYYSTAPSDNYVRMKAEDYDRWSTFDDYNAYDAYYAPGYAYGIYPSYGFGYGMGLGFGYGLGFYDPFLAWNSYYMWNAWYNPYFYNPYYGGAVFVYSKGVGGAYGGAGATAALRPFSPMAYRNGVTSTRSTTSGNRFYRPGMTGTTTYNSRINSGSTGRSVNNTYYNNRPANSNNTYRPAFNNNNSNFGRSYSPSSGGSSFGGGGGFRAGGGGFRGH